MLKKEAAIIRNQRKAPKQKETAFSSISARSFVTVVAVLLLILCFCGSLSYWIPQGEFARDADNNILLDTYQEGETACYSLNKDTAGSIAISVSQRYLFSQMIAGEIMDQQDMLLYLKKC